MTQTLILHTLGNITVASSQTTQLLALCPQEQALLTYLAYENCALSRDFLCDLFWPGYPVENARRNLRKLLLLARRHLALFLVTEREQISLHPACTYWVDVREFQHHIHKVGHLTAQSGALTATAVQHLQQAVQIYRGDFLAGLKQPESEIYTAWLQQQQELLHQQAQQAFLAYAAYLAAQHNAAPALEVLQSWLRIAPYAEPIHLQLLRLWASTGQVNRALRHYEQYRARLEKELAEPPETALTALYEQLRVGFLPESVVERSREDRVVATSPLAASADITLLPPLPMTPLLGSSEVLEKIVQTIRSSAHRLVTLVGIGGVGKTHLALTVAQQVQKAYPQGVCFIALGSGELPTTGTEETLQQATTRLAVCAAQALQLTLVSDHFAHQQVINHVRGRAMLLIFDSFSSVMTAAPFLLDLLKQAPQVTILVTSCERLQLAGEMVIPVRSLSLSAAQDEQHAAAAQRSENNRASVDLAQLSPAVQLFVARARDYAGSFRLTCDNLPPIRQICGLVGGHPLAIEMAAAWVGHLQCTEIAAALQQDLALLTHNKRGIPPHHRSIDALFRHTWEQLPPIQQQGLLQLACFIGVFSRQAVFQITDVTLPVLKALTDKALLSLRAGERYELHPLVRRWIYAKQQVLGLENEEVPTKVWQKYCHYCLTLVAEPKPLLTLEPDNIRQAWQQALALQLFKLLRTSLTGLMQFYRRLGLLGEASACCEVIALQAQHALPTSSAPDQQNDLTCLLAHCHAILATIHREIDEAVQTASQSPGLTRPLSPPVRNRPEPILVDSNRAAVPAWIERETDAHLPSEGRFPPLPTYESVAGVAHSCD